MPLTSCRWCGAVAKRGRKQTADDFLAMEIHRVMRLHHCGARAACRRIAAGEAEELPPRNGKRHFTVGSLWRGISAGTLEQRYFRWLRREEAKQVMQAITVKISD